MAPALLVGLLAVTWRLLGNAWLLNDDFLPGVSVADLGGGVVAGLVLFALLPFRRKLHRPPAEGFARDWLWTSGLAAVAVFVANVVFI